MTGQQAGARPNREGDPWQRADGRWTVRVWPPKGTIDRKPRYVYGKTRRDAISKRRDLEVKLGRGLPSDPDQTVGDYFHRWLGTTLPQYVAAGEMAESTMDSYRDNARKHIVPEDAEPTLGHIKLTDLSAPAVREWQKQLAQKPSGRARRTLREGETELPPPAPLSLRTVAYCRAILHKALEDALRDEAAGLERNVVSLVKPPRKRQKRARPTVPPEDVGKLLVAMADDRLWCYWFLAFALGFRRGEGLGMEWGDLDFGKRPGRPAHRAADPPGPRPADRPAPGPSRRQGTEDRGLHFGGPAPGAGRRGAPAVAAGSAQDADDRGPGATSSTSCSRRAPGRRSSRGASTGRGNGCARTPGCLSCGCMTSGTPARLPPRAGRGPEDRPGIPAARERVHDAVVPARAGRGPARAARTPWTG